MTDQRMILREKLAPDATTTSAPQPAEALPTITVTTVGEGITASVTEEIIPPKPVRLAEVLAPRGNAPQLALTLSLEEIGAIAASLQTMVHYGVIKHPSQVDLANSILRKFHDAKVEYAKTLP